ncbi:MAG: NAD-dependent epimerase/dehydratase family protein [Candidatus Micrarchaeota archaeon]|nr:NAD-dependent epimerase/dehydratase family protein [Candidatus Micrarchaeota archaeon]
MERVVITGGTGFLGSNLAKGLIKAGRDVTLIAKPASHFEGNLKDLGIEIEPINGDIKDYEFISGALKGCDTLYHFAAEVGNVSTMHGSKGAALSVMQTNMMIDMNIFRACAANGVSKIIYPSSAAVYPTGGRPEDARPFREEDADVNVNPEGGYGWAKYIAEKELGFLSDIKVGIARIFHTYGRNISLSKERSQVMASLMRKAILYPSEGFTVWGDGTQRRGFVYVEDLVDALLKLDAYVDKKESLIVNIGSNQEITVAELAKEIVRISGKQINIQFDTSKPSGSLVRQPNLEKIGRTLGWKPTTEIRTGLETTYRWASSRLAEGGSKSNTIST